jgi:hypothetical protein
MKAGFEQKETKATENPLPLLPLFPPVETQKTSLSAFSARRRSRQFHLLPSVRTPFPQFSFPHISPVPHTLTLSS